jgi:hypothetical protein
MLGMLGLVGDGPSRMGVMELVLSPDTIGGIIMIDDRVLSIGLRWLLPGLRDCNSREALEPVLMRTPQSGRLE